MFSKKKQRNHGVFLQGYFFAKQFFDERGIGPTKSFGFFRGEGGNGEMSFLGEILNLFMPIFLNHIFWWFSNFILHFVPCYFCSARVCEGKHPVTTILIDFSSLYVGTQEKVWLNFVRATGKKKQQRFCNKTKQTVFYFSPKTVHDKMKPPLWQNWSHFWSAWVSLKSFLVLLAILYATLCLYYYSTTFFILPYFLSSGFLSNVDLWWVSPQPCLFLTLLQP